ncbi:MAG: hypothetical protein WD770_10495 [Actinomycetota bacterium]
MKRRILAVALAAGVLVSVAAPALAQTYPPPRDPTCNVDDRTVEPGQSVRIGGRRWQANTTIRAGFHQKSTDASVEVTTSTNAEGTWFTSITVPSDVENGPAAFGAQGRDKGGGRFRCIISVTVVGAADATSASTATPAGITTGMVSIAAVVAFGIFLLVSHRRRMRKLSA